MTFEQWFRDYYGVPSDNKVTIEIEDLEDCFKIAFEAGRNEGYDEAMEGYMNGA